jgi:hypothetical protein
MEMVESDLDYFVSFLLSDEAYRVPPDRTSRRQKANMEGFGCPGAPVAGSHSGIGSSPASVCMHERPDSYRWRQRN